ncbi:NEQ231 [Nanoarchaeum equitans Kin4-M]|uniref:Transcription elongation factor Spt4 n=1 Tax=Nanoarchaeum equitans (strain Kin4-M) TaxID=228908 RepID=Q74NE2_NANEQ|nr:NEQ231 [Nanoarchaeum equitans Kin4-M]
MPKPKRKVCLKCKAILPMDVEKCPYCGGTEFTTEFEGIIIIVNKEKSEVAKVAGIDKEGKFAIKI